MRGRALDLFKNTLSFKLCLFLGLSVLAGIVMFSLYFLYYQASGLRENARKELADLGGIVKRNTRRSMQSNHPEGIEDIIKTAAEQENILLVRIYDRSGTVRYASDSTSIGITVDRNAPSCRACHARDTADVPPSEKESVFPTSLQGVGGLAIVTPILGGRSCYEAPCHHHPPAHALLGILEIHRSLDDVGAIVKENVGNTVLFGLVLFVMVSSITAFFVLRFVHRPVRNLVDSAARLSSGDYGQEVPVPGGDELGQLTMAFNEMSRKIAERQTKLFKSREEFKTLFNEVPAYIVVLDQDLTIRNANQVYRDHYGDHIGERCFETHFGTDKACEDCPVIKTFSDAKVHSLERIRRLPDGTERTFLVHTAPLRDQAGHIESVMEISTDVTSVKALQRELASLGETVAGISHAIRNILQGLEGGMHVFEIALRKDNRDLMQKGWDMVQRNVKLVSGLVRDILFLSRERQPELADIDPGALCGDVMDLMRDRAAEDGVRIELQALEKAGTIHIDPKGLHTVLVNLMTNAIEACREDRSSRPHHVILKYGYDPPAHIVFEVEDNGAGMSRETRESLFRRFFSTKGTAGTGLGLLVTKKIVEEHGGRITLESRQGEGTAFSVRLPAGTRPLEIPPTH